MLLITTETASFGAVSPQKLLQILSAQAVRNSAEVHDAETARGRNPHSSRIWTHLSSSKASLTAAFVTTQIRGSALLVSNRSSSLRSLLLMVFILFYRDFFQN
jgi:hypothetical protein